MSTLDAVRMQRVATALDANNAAIRAKGVTVPAGTKFDAQAALIGAIPVLTTRTGSLTPSADGMVITLPEDLDGALALWVHCDLDQAKAKGTNTIYEALGVMPPGRDVVANTIYRSVNASGALAMGGTAPVADENGKIKISTSKYWRAGLAYDYILWYGGQQT